MKFFAEKNDLKLDRLRKLGDYFERLMYERDPNVILTEQPEPITKRFFFRFFINTDMSKNEVSILLEILDLEYLKPI
jgi:hypothetical protein